MIYNIPYNQNFISLLQELVKKNLVIAPGKYLTDALKSKGINCISYDDLLFRMLPNRASNIAESILIDQAMISVKKNPTVQNALKRAIHEFYYYGLRASDLVCLNAQHDLLKNTIETLNHLTKTSKIFFRASALRDTLNNLENIQLNGTIYAILPVIFSPLLFDLIKALREKFSLHIILYGLQENLDYELSCESPQFFLHEFLKAINVTEVTHLESNEVIHSNAINNGINQLTCPILSDLHECKLYNFNHIQRYEFKFLTEEMQGIANIVMNSQHKTISIVTKNTQKLRMLYQYLKTELSGSERGFTLQTSTPTYCFDYEEMKLFFRLLDLIGVREQSLFDIFDVLRHTASKVNQEIIINAQKFLLEQENVYDVGFAQHILRQAGMNDAADLLQMIEKFNNTSSKYSLPEGFLEIKNQFDKFLSWHIYCFLCISETMPNALIELLQEMQRFFSNLQFKMSLRDYKNIMFQACNQHIINPNQSYEIAGENNIEVHLLTSVERRFLYYDLTIICDLKEGVWPPAANDHFFISEQTRKMAGYSRPANYEIGYAAHDFVSILASSKEVIISELNESEMFIENTRTPAESRFLLLLLAYNAIGQFENGLCDTIAITKQDIKHEKNQIAMSVPVEMRPKSFSATSLEKCMKNPYTYSIEYNLKLKYLAKFLNEKPHLPSNREFGVIVHAILNDLSKVTKYESYDDFHSMFFEITNKILQIKYGKKFEYMMILWKEKLQNIMRFVYEYNIDMYQKHGTNIITETEKHIVFNIILENDIQIKLHAFADRIDFATNHVWICDYKTGQLPTKQEIILGIKPQLSLEGLIMALSNEHLQSHDITLRYIRLTGITNEVRDVKFDFPATFNGIHNILHQLYIQGVPYASTEKYDNYLQAQIMRTIYSIEHKF